MRFVDSGSEKLTSSRSPTASQEEGLRIVVIEGEDRVNIMGQGTAVPTVVEVRDRNDLPVSGASVVFLLGDGGTATLNAGLSQIALTTNALGQAAVTGHWRDRHARLCCRRDVRGRVDGERRQCGRDHERFGGGRPESPWTIRGKLGTGA